MTRRRTPTPRRLGRWHGLLGVLAVAIVAMVAWIAFNANSGLPLQNRTKVFVRVPDAARLIDTADVRIGGNLVGKVLDVEAIPGRAGARPSARLELALDSDVGPVPVDSTLQIRPASVLGLTYVDLTLGRSRQLLADGDELPLAQARASSNVTDLFEIFDSGSARGFRAATKGLAHGLAGRGSALGTTIESLAALMPPLRDVAGTLAAPQTRLGPFIGGYADTVDALAAVREPLGRLVGDGATTFDALASVRGALGATIERAPGAERATTVAFTRARPALDGLARLSASLRPAGRLLPATLGEANATLDAGAPALRSLRRFARPLRPALLDLRRLARDPNTTNALRKLHDLIEPTGEVLAHFAPAQAQCNVFGTWSQQVAAGLGSLGSGKGPSLPHAVVASLGAQGEVLQNASPSPDVQMNALPTENASECQSGNEPVVAGQQLDGPSEKTSNTTRDTVPPPGVVERARAAGLLDPIEGTP